MGNWARVPWAACLDQRETTTTRRNVYVVYLFREDMSGVYLTLNQGVTAYTGQFGRAEARAKLRARAEQLRTQRSVAQLARHGFVLDNTLDLHTEAALGRDYEFGTIAYKLYAQGGVPLDDVLQEDLERVLQAYEGYVASAQASAATAAAPAEPDLETALPPASAEPIASTPVGTRIFVSHSHHDVAFCRAFVQGLRAHQLDVWYDEHNLGSGMLREAIERDMAARDSFIVILSPEALKSQWVKREWNAALDLEDAGQLHTIVPVLAEPCEIPLMLRGYKRIQARDGASLTAEEAASQAVRILTGTRATY
jgi:MrcB-like, N-terminal domain/TIR domain